MKSQSKKASAPRASRPHIPGYGIPTTRKGMLSWDHAEERLGRSRHDWVATSSTDGRPHAVPVWGVWLEGALCFGGGPQTRWARNLFGNPAVSIHLEPGDDVVILEGTVERVSDPEDPLVERVRDAYDRKYETRHPPSLSRGIAVRGRRPASSSASRPPRAEAGTLSETNG